MSLEFDIKLTAKDMYRFNMYQAYSGFQGWFSILISIGLFVLAGVTFGETEGSRTMLYIIFGVIFLFYTPLALSVRSKHSIASSEVLSGSLHYRVDEKGFTVSQGDASAELPWGNIYKMAATKNNVLVYSNRTNAYIIPRSQLMDRYGRLVELANKKLPKYRVKMK